MKSPQLLAVACMHYAVLTVGSPAIAVAQPFGIDPVVVTATRIAQPASTLLSDVRVIDRDDIANAAGQSLLDVLRTHGGVEIAVNGGPGQIGAVFIRGANANHVVVLVDGVRLQSATAGTTAFENLPLDQIERIEVVRGPASSLYGADAIGGVIQIFTRKDGDRATLSAGAGTWNTQRYAAAIARSSGSTRWSLRGGYEESRAFSATNAANAFSFDPDDDPYRNRNAAASVSHEWRRGHEIVGRTLVSEGTTHFDAGPGSDDVNRQRLSTLALESRDAWTSAWSSVLRVARSTDDIATRGSFPSEFRTDQDQASWQHDLRAGGGTLQGGVDYRQERVTSSTDYSATRRRVWALFGGYSGAFGPHLLQASARRDDYSDFGDRTTGNAGYGYRITREWRVSAAAGTAFKAPTFNDLYFTSPFFSGNPALKPERSTQREAALHFDDGARRASLTAFENRIRDLIAVDPTFTTVVNVNQARIRGATLAVGIDAGNHRLKAELTRENPVDVETGHRLVRRARLFGALSVTGSAGAWRWTGEITGSGERFDAVSNAAASRLAGYGLVNLRVAYAVTPRASVSVRWNNVLDKSYTLVRGYNTPGSNVFVMVELSHDRAG